MAVNYAASSLYNVIGDRQFKATTAGKAAWMSLISVSNLQPNCNKEGFNARANEGYLRSRIGIFANDETECKTCESWLGFGCGYYPNGISQKMVFSCGNISPFNDDDDDNPAYTSKNILAVFGYIFVQ